MNFTTFLKLNPKHKNGKECCELCIQIALGSACTIPQNGSFEDKYEENPVRDNQRFTFQLLLPTVLFYS
jgi:hypothetical protein